MCGFLEVWVVCEDVRCGVRRVARGLSLVRGGGVFCAVCNGLRVGVALDYVRFERQGAKRARGTGPATKVMCLPVDPALYNYIFIPIHLQRGRHWLLASIDVKARKMQPYDCSQKYGSKWRGQIHSLLWVWFMASVRRLRAMGTAIQEEPQWGVDMCNVDLQDVEDLPGLRSPGVRSKLVESRLNKCAPDITRLLGGAALSRLAVLNITVEGDRPNGQ